MIKQKQFLIFKFHSQRLEKSKYNIAITIQDARKNEELISLADSEFLRVIRRVTDHPYNNEDYYMAKKKNDKTKLDKLQFIPDYISVIIDNNGHYKKIKAKGIVVNGIKFKRFSCSPSNGRDNTVFFINENIYEKTKEILSNGANQIKILPSKYNAYFSLLSSSTYTVTSPKAIVVKDYTIQTKHMFDFVESNDQSFSIEKKEINIENYVPFDGMGIISLRMARVWASDLEVDYVPSAFCIRNAYIKGMVCTIDFHEYAIENRCIDTIEDIWGVKYKIEDIDIILTESQFKFWQAYDSWESYIKNLELNKINWGVTKISPNEDKKNSFTNYQFLQALNLNDEDLMSLCNPTIEWIKDVCGDDVNKTLLFMLGNKINWNNIEDNALKALLINKDMITDQYIKNRVIRSINKKIKEAYSGKLITHGNFSVMISDPIVLIQYAFGMPINSFLKNNEHYSNNWNKENVKNVVACRSPLTFYSEVNKLNLIQTPDTEKWYQYITSGIIYNIYGNDTFIHADSDFDFDLVYTTNNAPFLNSVHDKYLPITYNKKNRQKIDISEDDLYEADINSFDSKIGYITNCSTTMYEMLSMYEEGSREYDELIHRLKYCRFLQGSEIDKAKLGYSEEIPKYWTSEKDCDETDDPAFNKKLLIKNRPYFMRYIYSEYDREYKNYIDKNERISHAVYNCSIEENNNPEFVDNFIKYSPLLNTSGTMNKVCHYIEESLSFIDHYRRKDDKMVLKEIFDIENFEIDKVQEDPLLSEKTRENTDKIKTLIQMAKVYMRENRDRKSLLKYVDDEIKKIGTFEEIFISIFDIYYNDKINENKAIIWDIFGSYIIAEMLIKTDRKISYPYLDENGDIEYLNEYYNIKEESV